MEIRAYQLGDETGWVRCRVLSFLDSAYFDNVLPNKEHYEHPAIELVAIADDKVVGLIDVEYETKEHTVCSRGTGCGGMIWHLAVHPDFRRQKIANKLLIEAERISKEKGLNRFEAWTRNDEWVNAWYINNGFKKVSSYLHVYIENSKELDTVINSAIPNLHPVQTFAHYVGEEKEKIKKQFGRVHECNCFEKALK